MPVVTLILVAANMLAAFGLLFNPDLAYQFGFRPDQPSARGALTSMFLHANVLHLLGNMVFLAAVGSAVEMATGSFRFASVYFLSGLFGVALHFMMTRRLVEPEPYIGASGCIAGCVAYYTFRYQAMRVPLVPKVAMPVMAITGMWLLLQVVGAFVRLGESGGTAFWAHIGGFVSGILLSLVFRAPDLGMARLGHEAIEKMGERGPAAVQAMARRHLKSHPRDPKALWELARSSEALNDQTSEVPALTQLVDLLPPMDQAEALLRLCSLGRAGEIPALRRTMLADGFKKTHPNLARALLQSVIEEREGGQRPDALLALAALEREQRPAEANALLADLQRDYPLHPAVDLARKRGWIG